MKGCGCLDVLLLLLKLSCVCIVVVISCNSCWSKIVVLVASFMSKLTLAKSKLRFELFLGCGNYTSKRLNYTTMFCSGECQLTVSIFLPLNYIQTTKNCPFVWFWHFCGIKIIPSSCFIWKKILKFVRIIIFWREIFRKLCTYYQILGFVLLSVRLYWVFRDSPRSGGKANFPSGGINQIWVNSLFSIFDLTWKL